MIKQGAILSQLRSIAGPEHAREAEAGGYDVDGLAPQAIVEPGTYEEVAEVIRFANSERLAVIPRGAGGRVHVGNLPARYDIALSLARLNEVIEHEPADLTVTCQAGMGAGALNAQLAASSQMVPFGGEPESPRTVGGHLAAGESGLQAAYGRPRDFTIGLRFVTGDGVLARTGGRVVKNVAGYDLAKLFIGSRGTLAVIVECTFKVAPLPAETRALDFLFPSIDDLALFSNEARRRTLALLSAIAAGAGGAEGQRVAASASVRCHVVCGGARAAVERTVNELQTLAASHHATLLEQPGPPGPGSTDAPVDPGEALLECQASLPPSQLAEAVRALEAEIPAASFRLDPFAGQISVTCPGAGAEEDVVEGLRGAISRLGGHLTVSRCHSELKRRIDVFGPPPPSFPLMRAVKREFDPNNVLSPGRFVGRL